MKFPLSRWREREGVRVGDEVGCPSLRSGRAFCSRSDRLGAPTLPPVLPSASSCPALTPKQRQWSTSRRPCPHPRPLSRLRRARGDRPYHRVQLLPRTLLETIRPKTGAGFGVPDTAATQAPTTA